jgi:hypothetical protein
LKAARFGDVDEVARFEDVQREWLLDVDVHTCLQALQRDRMMGIRWCRHVNYVRSGLGQKDRQIVERVADPEARGRLMCQIEVLVANGHDVGLRYSAQLQQVSIGNLTAPDDRHPGCAHGAIPTSAVH